VAVLSQRPTPPVVRGIPRLVDSHLIERVAPSRLARRNRLLPKTRQCQQQSGGQAEFARFQEQAFDVLTAPQLRECFEPSMMMCV